MNLQDTKRSRTEKLSGVSDAIEEKIIRLLLPDVEKLAACDLNYTPVNITDTSDSLTVEICAPGFKKSDFVVVVEDNELLVLAEREDGVFSDDELTQPFLKRAFALPAQIEVSKISASYNDGVLRVLLPERDDKDEHVITDIPVM